MTVTDFKTSKCQGLVTDFNTVKVTKFKCLKYLTLYIISKLIYHVSVVNVTVCQLLTLCISDRSRKIELDLIFFMYHIIKLLKGHKSNTEVRS